MADLALSPMPLLGGADIPLGANRIVERTDLCLVSVAVPQGGEAALAGALQSAHGLDMPTARQSSTAGDLSALRLSPDQLLLILPGDDPQAEPALRAALDGAGYTTDQTDAWIVLDITGPETIGALERLCPLDLASFAEGEFARTVMEHMGAVAVRLGDAEFRLLSASSSAASFLHAVELSYTNVLP